VLPKATEQKTRLNSTVQPGHFPERIIKTVYECR
jgi:hypothetical protein